MRVIIHALFWLTLTCWIALVVAPGLTGMTAFKVLEQEGATIPKYQAYFADDPTGMSRLAAGLVTDPLFRLTSLAQWILAPLAVVLCLIEFRPLRMSSGWAQAFRLPLLVAALGLVIYHNAVMGPRMAHELETYRSAAASMDRPASEAARARFDEDHTLAESLYSIRLLLLLGAVVATAGANAVASPRPRSGRSS
ncbi:MAG: hypothetical protein CBC35_03600 [Planctomycetes bacterium TMED75]|nr:hypothetical protein [Planctomycetaceae bacterium]OUU94658.1 MAG: hypothetical protein CBC35_03600 [Planctomycetes bacterium TMED75]